jgi:hypothetical protein
MAGGWRRLHNEELPNSFASPTYIKVIKSRRVRWAGHAEGVERMINAYKILVRKPEEKRQLGGPRRGWEDNIRKNIREIRWEGMDWMHLAQDRDQWQAFVKTVINLRVL